MVAGMGVGIANAAVKITNAFYFRHRPFDTYEVNLLFYPPTDSSFPANPVAITIAMATGVWMANRKIGAAMFVVALIYGFSRVYAGVFYPLDVLGGALIGLGAAYLVSLVLKLIEPVPTLCLQTGEIPLRRLSGDFQDPQRPSDGAANSSTTAAQFLNMARGMSSTNRRATRSPTNLAAASTPGERIGVRSP